MSLARSMKLMSLSLTELSKVCTYNNAPIYSLDVGSRYYFVISRYVFKTHFYNNCYIATVLYSELKNDQ